MSPDPTQEPIEESLNIPNLPLDRGMNASDSEDDDIGMAGYVPLSQIPADSDPMLYEDEVCLLFNEIFHLYMMSTYITQFLNLLG